jgi:hypothetical protein
LNTSSSTLNNWMCNKYFILAFRLDCMNTKAIFCTTFIIATGVCFVIPEITISYGLANTHHGNDTTTKIQENDSNTTAIKAPSHKDYAYRLQVKVEGLDQQEVNVSSSANTASGISVAKGSQLIDSRFNTRTIYVYLYGNHSAEVNSFNTCAVRLNGTKVCENTILEGELVLLNFNTFK